MRTYGPRSPLNIDGYDDELGGLSVHARAAQSAVARAERLHQIELRDLRESGLPSDRAAVLDMIDDMARRCK